MKITLLLTQSLQSPGGGGRYWPLAKALTQLGHEVTIIALHHDYEALQKYAFVAEQIAVQYVGQMHVLKRGNRKSYFSPTMLLWITAVATWKLFWAAWRTPADAIHVCKTQPMNGTAAWLIHILRGTPIYLDSDDYEAINNRFSGKWQQRIVAWFEDKMPTFAAGITAGTSFIANRFIAQGYPSEQVQIVYNGVDRHRFAVLEQSGSANKLQQLRQQLAISEASRVVVYVGSMSLTSHAVDLLLEAFQYVIQNVPDAMLLMVGFGEDLPLLQEKAQALQLAGHVRFVGRIALDEVPFYYRLGNVSADPMRISVPAESSLSLKLLESMAALVPCVTADIGDRRQVVGEAGLAVMPDDAGALAEGLCTLLNSAQLAGKMRDAAALQRAQNWWDVRVHDFVKVYQHVAD